ncbi:MAG: hypothetical protein LUC93_10930 [Planctomycetaceae bacterium]|nr:hypothetical protein [Planctomycetaceae bacterium]
MDEPSMNHVLDASEFSANEVREAAAAASEKIPLRDRFNWQTIIRCLFLGAILAVIVVMSWRPGLLRFSLLLSMVSPSRGESLAWQPEQTVTPHLPQRKFTPAPAEWRLAAGHAGSWQAGTTGAELVPHWQGGPIAGSPWQRLTVNPWSWQDDVVSTRRRVADAAVQPAQKPATAFRAEDSDSWGLVQQPASISLEESSPLSIPDLAPLPAPAAPVSSERTTLQPLPSLPSLPALPSIDAPTERPSLALPPLTMPEPPARTATPPVSAPDPVSMPSPTLTPTPTPTSAPSAGVISLEPLEFDDQNSQSSLRPPSSQPVQPPERSTTTVAATAPDASEPENVDWKNREITGRIPGAYLTIYPKLKFVGLCVPGQGYIRKYNQVGVPRDLTTQPKLAADDGRTPYGKYYIAGRARDINGPNLVLSWPSPDDVRRLGVAEDVVTAVEMAWLDRILPPQSTMAGGNLRLAGTRQWVESTDGGFSLEAPHLEEIYTALPEGAWVFIQE